MFTLPDIFELAIQLEKNGESRCRQILHKRLDPQLNELMLWMATEEKKHINWLQELKTAANALEGNTALDKTNRALLTGMLGQQSFSLGDADFDRIDDPKTLAALLIEFESDTVLFYELIRTLVTEPQTLAYLDRIIAEEKNHADNIKAYADQFGTRSLRP